jgi:hypothetical protein
MPPASAKLSRFAGFERREYGAIQPGGASAETAERAVGGVTRFAPLIPSSLTGWALAASGRVRLPSTRGDGCVGRSASAARVAAAGTRGTAAVGTTEPAARLGAVTRARSDDPAAVLG